MFSEVMKAIQPNATILLNHHNGFVATCRLFISDSVSEMVQCYWFDSHVVP